MIAVAALSPLSMLMPADAAGAEPAPAVDPGFALMLAGLVSPQPAAAVAVEEEDGAAAEGEDAAPDADADDQPSLDEQASAEEAAGAMLAALADTPPAAQPASISASVVAGGEGRRPVPMPAPKMALQSAVSESAAATIDEAMRQQGGTNADDATIALAPSATVKSAAEARPVSETQAVSRAPLEEPVSKADVVAVEAGAVSAGREVAAASVAMDARTTVRPASTPVAAADEGVAASIVAAASEASDDAEHRDEPRHHDDAPVAMIPPQMAALRDVTPAPATTPTAVGTGAASTIDHQVALAHDSAWLDQLARDISGSAAAAGSGRVQLQVAPEGLGSIGIEISKGEDGYAVTLTAENEATRDRLAEARPRLIAEADAHGVRIATAEVALAASADPARQQQAGQQQGGQASPQQQPSHGFAGWSGGGEREQAQNQPPRAVLIEAAMRRLGSQDELDRGTRSAAAERYA